MEKSSKIEEEIIDNKIEDIDYDEEEEEEEEAEDNNNLENEEEDETKKCSLDDHKEKNAIIYCHECKIFMCNICQIHHYELFKNHHTNKINNLNIEEDIYTGICKEKNHSMALDYFCKDHNQLCCSACLCTIKGKGSGKHSDCDVCFIKKVRKEKKNKLNENIKYLEDLSLFLEDSIYKLKQLFETITENKEDLKVSIQNIFTQIRYTINSREDELLNEVDNQFDIIFFKKDLVKEGEKLPDKVKLSIEKGKAINNDWNDKDQNKLSSLINDCVNIENNITNINKINDSIKKCNLIKDLKIKFSPDKKGIDEFLNSIKSFGKIYYINFKFKECTKEIDENRKYEVVGEKKNTIVKAGTNGFWTGVICENKLEQSKIYKFKFTILKSYCKCNYIKVGVAPIDFDTNKSYFNNGWFIDCSSSFLYSGEPQNYNGKFTYLNKIKDEVILIMDMEKGTLKFIIDNEDNGESYSDIPIDKPLSPAVFLYYNNDSVEINEC